MTGEPMSRFRRSLRAARARYSVEPSWLGTLELDPRADRRPVRRGLRDVRP